MHTKRPKPPLKADLQVDITMLLCSKRHSASVVCRVQDPYICNVCPTTAWHPLTLRSLIVRPWIKTVLAERDINVCVAARVRERGTQESQGHVFGVVLAVVERYAEKEELRGNVGVYYFEIHLAFVVLRRIVSIYVSYECVSECVRECV
jgi:hypothetical protein